MNDTPHLPDPLETPSEAGLGQAPQLAIEEVQTPLSPSFQEFVQKLASFQTPEEKVAYGLEFMRTSISQEGSPRFREFWEARRLILLCFKENLNAAIRSKLWGEYVELTIEARRLKEILEEQSAFAMEQIDLAVRSIENDLTKFEALLEQAEPFEFPGRCETISDNVAAYGQIQRELGLLNTLASRLNALRKEVIKTDMRIRFKAKFFKRISELGDHIFPKRKALIETISSEFEKDIARFVEAYFKDGAATGAPYYALREEIKALQGMAKIFTLSSGAFNRTRLCLSECWDLVKVLEKEHKKEVFEKKQASSEQRGLVETKMEELRARSAEMSLRELEKEIEGILQEMRSLNLHRDDVWQLREELSKMREPYIVAQEKKQRELEEAEKEQLRLKKEKIIRFKEEVILLQKEGAQIELEVLAPRFEVLLKFIETLDAPKVEKQQLERSLRPLKDLLADKKEQSLLNLSDDDRKTLDNLRTILQQKKERRQEIKEALEGYRKSLGKSNLDFEKAMQMRELVDQEKERLEKANFGIQEIETKISELES